MKTYKGIGVSKGIAIGKAYIYENEGIDLSSYFDKEKTKEEKKASLKIAIERVKKALLELYEDLKKVAKKESEIITFQVLTLDDPDLIDRIHSFIDKGDPLPHAIEKAFEGYIKLMQGLNSGYLRERVKDIEDIKERLIREVIGKPKRGLSHLPSSVIVFAKELTPSDTAGIDREHILGIVTEEGGRTSHTAILSEALGIPSVLGIRSITKEVTPSDTVIIDGEEGEVIISPPKETIALYEKRLAKLKEEKERSEKTRFLPAITSTGKRIEVSANIGSPEDIEIALLNGADSIGLFRTEFLFLERNTPPTEEEQFNIYKRAAEKFGEKPVIIRTLDIGGDKEVPYLSLKKEQNPFLGIRGIRLCLLNKELFKTQLRAILKASNYGKLKVMYPMVSVKEEIIRANEVLDTVKDELKRENIPFDEDIEVGIMIEVPGASLSADELIEYADFFSIGTNDLIQYTFAADRTNNDLDYLYLPTHPAILKLIKFAVDASHKKGKWTGVCGEMAGDTNAIPYLIELGVDELSMSPQKIPQAKELIRTL